MSSLPTSTADYAQMAIENVKIAIGVEPDFTPETLPLIDAYLQQARTSKLAEVRSLVITTAGVYFGEVMLRLLDGWWNTANASPSRWRVEVRPCFLYFYPVGTTGEVLLGRESDQFNGTFSVLEELKEELQQRLKASAPVTDEEYFSLCGRCDSLQIVSEWLLARAQQQDGPLIPLEAEDYLNLAPPIS